MIVKTASGIAKRWNYDLPNTRTTQKPQKRRMCKNHRIRRLQHLHKQIRQLKPTQEAQVLKIVGVNGRHVALNCNHVIVACVISERWL